MSLEEQNSELMKIVIETRAYQKTIYKKVDTIEQHLAAQNGRLRKVEQQNSAIKAMGSIVTVVFSAVIGWMFKIK
jgi:hypothetical protein|tara:strand:- start:1324 stop:1548 length:225 start_codon:yes stop_codon:yes gene_type:complete